MTPILDRSPLLPGAVLLVMLDGQKMQRTMVISNYVALNPKPVLYSPKLMNAFPFFCNMSFSEKA